MRAYVQLVLRVDYILYNLISLTHDNNMNNRSPPVGYRVWFFIPERAAKVAGIEMLSADELVRHHDNVFISIFAVHGNRVVFLNTSSLGQVRSKI